jgi:uncharacterized hydrophobic protein (TIGR00271 family)
MTEEKFPKGELPSVIPEPPDDLLGKVAYYFNRLRIRLKFLWRKMVPPVERERRSDVQIQLRETSTPNFEFFVMVILSCMIATFGLLTDSEATIIGAMLVAPLMSPVLGIGLASIRGDTVLLRNAVRSLLQGALLIVIISFLITLTNRLLPFINLQEIPSIVFSNSRPSPFHLGIALAGGLAASFALVQPKLSATLPGVAVATALTPPMCTIGIGLALGDWNIAGGGLLMFITNGITIAASAMFIFWALGFRRRRKEDEGRIPRSMLITSLLTMLLFVPLGWQSYQFVQDANLTREINLVVTEEVGLLGAELSDMDWLEFEDVYNITVTILVSGPLVEFGYEDSLQLQENIAVRLQETVALKVNKIFANKLDPAIPPTPTPTMTTGPSPTPTETQVPPTETSTPTITPSPTPTNTPTPQPTYTGTPVQASASNMYLSGIYLRLFPGGPEVGFLEKDSIVSILYGYEIFEGWVWVDVIDEEGRIGWVPLYYLATATPDE